MFLRIELERGIGIFSRQRGGEHQYDCRQKRASQVCFAVHCFSPLALCINIAANGQKIKAENAISPGSIASSEADVYSIFGKGLFLPSVVMEHSVTEVRNAGYDSQEDTSLAVTSTS